MIYIESKDNNFFKATKKLKDKRFRNKEGKFILEGFRLIEEATKANMEIEYIILSQENEEKLHNSSLKEVIGDDKIYVFSSALFSQISSTEHPQGVIAIVKNKKMIINLEGQFFLICDKVQDPGNLGTIIRTAHAVKADGIILTKGTVDIYNEKTIRSTMGSLFYVPVHYDDENMTLVKSLKDKKFKIVVTSLDTDKDFFQESLKGKVLLTVGNEGNGVSDEVYELADTKVKIPMPGNAESLNVAIATSVIMYEKIRQDLYD